MRRVALLGMACWVVACTDSAAPSNDDHDAGSLNDAASADAASQADATTTSTTDLFGELAIRLVAAVPASATSSATEGFTSVGGKLYDREPPAVAGFREDTSEAGCVLLKPVAPLFCDPACLEGVCRADNVCDPYAKAASAGVLTVRGLRTSEGPSEFSITPITGSYTTPGDVSLPFPAFAENDVISISADPFSVEAHGIAPLALNNQAIALSAGTQVALAWTPGGNSQARIAVTLDISHHGGTKGKIECDVADSGSLSISGSLVGKLLALGVAGFPTIKVIRYATSSARVGMGTVSMRVYSDVEREVQIAGLVSCAKTTDCPANQTCGSDLVCK